MEGHEELFDDAPIASMTASSATSATTSATTSPKSSFAMLGHLQPFQSPLHTSPIPLVYADFTASSRCLTSIESYLPSTLLPFYANTHTTTSVTGAQSTALSAEARQHIAEGVTAHVTGKAAKDVVLFTGAGSTSSINLACKSINLNKDAIVVTSPYEHHSNLLPYRESGATMHTAPCTPSGELDLPALARLLESINREHPTRLKIGAFAHASNITGLVTNLIPLTALLHHNNFLAFIDAATSAPYLPIHMNPPSAPNSYIDALFISPHKFLGGPGATGVLVIKKSLLSQTNPPLDAGGGTVFYVTATDHRYLSSRSERNEGGTPNLPAVVRAGLAFIVKRRMAPTSQDQDQIAEQEFKARDSALQVRTRSRCETTSSTG